MRRFVSLRILAGVVLLGMAAVFVSEASYVAASAYNLVQDEGSNVARRSTLNFVGAGVSVADSGGKTVVTIGGGGSRVFAGTFASLPACSTTEYVYSVLSSPLVGFCDGASNLTWRARGESLPSLLDFATLTNFTNDSAPSAWSTVNGVVVGATVSDAGTNLRLAGITPPAEPYTVTVFVQTYAVPGAGNSYAGLYVRNSTNGRIENTYFLSGNGGPGFLQTTRWTNATTFSTALLNRTVSSVNWLLGLRCAVTAANVNCDASTDGGISWSSISTSLRSDFITTIDDVGVVYANINTTVTASSLYYTLEAQ